MPRSILAACLIALAWAAPGPGNADAAGIEPPQGYVGIEQAFGEDPVAQGKPGFFRLDFGLVIDALPSNPNGTFWASTFVFHDSADGLPESHIGGDQGSYLGLQMVSAREQLAMFSVWWALEARPGPGAACLGDLEAWYADDRPFDPPIDDMAKTDPARQVDGGPFFSCRLQITLRPGTHYRLRLAEGRDPAWWSAWLIDDDTKEEHLIGDIRVPAAWGRLTSEVGGFIEHFGPMPKGCDSIPSSTATIAAAVGNDGAAKATVTARNDGACAEDLRPRYLETRLPDGSVQVTTE